MPGGCNIYHTQCGNNICHTFGSNICQVMSQAKEHGMTSAIKYNNNIF